MNRNYLNHSTPSVKWSRTFVPLGKGHCKSNCCEWSSSDETVFYSDDNNLICREGELTEHLEDKKVRNLCYLLYSHFIFTCWTPKGDFVLNSICCSLINCKGHWSCCDSMWLSNVFEHVYVAFSFHFSVYVVIRVKTVAFKCIQIQHLSLFIVPSLASGGVCYSCTGFK